MKIFLGIVLGLIMIGAVGAAGYFYRENQKAHELIKNPNQIIQSENKALVAKVAILIDVPADEDPSVATVDDLTALKGQPFFAKAAVGDKAIVYVKAKKAILYRPSTNKIIEVGPVTTEADMNSPSTTTTKSATPSPSSSLTATPFPSTNTNQ